MEQRYGDAVAVATAGARVDPKVALSLASFMTALNGDFEGAAALSFQAREAAECGDLVERALAEGATAFAAATVGEERVAFDWDTLLALAPGVEDTDKVSAFVRYLAVEAALGAARLDLVEALAPHSPAHRHWSDHPYGALMRVCSARVSAFRGRIDEAAEQLRGGSGDSGVLAEALVGATSVLVSGNAGDRAALKQQVDRVQALITDGTVTEAGYLGTGLHILLAYGLIALGDRLSAAQVILRAGGDASLRRMVLVDRAIGLEIVISAALEREDLVAALAWRDQARDIENLRAAMPAVMRMDSRIAFAEQRYADALEHARRAQDVAIAEGRAIEAAEAGILVSQAMIRDGAVAAAADLLNDLVAVGDAAGHRAVRQAASRTLRAGGRRLKPVQGGGWSALSAREREVARLLIAGADTNEVAEALVLSPATVRVHISRVLAAFGVASRIGLLVFAEPLPDEVGDLPQLTRRQNEVAALVATGSTNHAIAEALGIGLKAVDNHVGEIKRRLGVETRFGLARVWWAAQR